MMRRVRMQYVLTLQRDAAASVWKTVAAKIEAEMRMKGIRRPAKRLPPSLGRKPHFLYEDEFYTIDYGPVCSYDHSILIVDPAEGHRPDVEEWIYCAAQIGKLVHGWVVDREYDYWQNASDPLEYTAEGRSYAHLPMKSNELPYPLEQMIIDTSHNPGRRVLRPGYVEAVGYLMWFGEPFWQITGTSRQKVLAQEWLKCRELPGGLLRVQAADEPFTSAEGIQGEIQRKLRALLFPPVEPAGGNT